VNPEESGGSAATCICGQPEEAWDEILDSEYSNKNSPDPGMSRIFVVQLYEAVFLELYLIYRSNAQVFLLVFT
jgi:hypothetical protein